jgi:hypothetical protein
MQEFGKGYPYYLWIWGNFDGYFYMKIAKSGYIASRLPFFPLFPILIHIIHSTTYLPHLVSGLLVSHLSFFLALYVLYKLFRMDIGKKGSFYIFLLSILLFPTAYSYGSVYNDSLYLLLAVLTIYYGREKMWIMASLVGFAATLTRLNGLALFFFLLPEYYTANLKHIVDGYDLMKLLKSYRQILPRQIWKSKIFFIAVIPAAYFGYLYYIQRVFGNWKLIYRAMEVWRQNIPTFPIQVFWRYTKIFLYYRPFDILYLVALIEFTFVVLYLIAIIYAYKKIRLSYWIFFIISVLIPATTGTFQGMPRYGLQLYPLFLVLYLLIYKRSLVTKVIYVLLLIALSLICVTLYTRGYFIA